MTGPFEEGAEIWGGGGLAADVAVGSAGSCAERAAAGCCTAEAGFDAAKLARIDDAVAAAIRNGRCRLRGLHRSSRQDRV